MASFHLAGTADVEQLRVSKYTDGELKEMALVVIQDSNEGGERSFQLLITMSVVLNMDPADVMERIKVYARGT